ncbi:Spo0E family sporulation regulatory protein-aspartic acid phosphatase [Clostridium sp.]|uniref:Spo0E family sporulation regulatory protein-aspartic acid phosphatase n=1 Tax=Clostridium sp. TaxID=1506 RepID=UPI00262D2A73|nr:Spo0E family sporulation regulatory protein-aspartic acid phosphatase [Clostridium sp.]
MDFSCDNCNLNYNIGKVRNRLEELIVKKDQSLLDVEVINLSQLLDNLIYKCVFCSKNVNNSTQWTLNDTLKSKTNSKFYHLKNNHFFISIYFYMYEGIKNNEVIYMSMEEGLYNDLLEILKMISFPVEYIKFRSIKELIISNKFCGLIGLEEKIKGIVSEYEAKRYNGIRWISQPTYAIKNTSLNDFFDWEMNLSQALRNTNTNSSLDFVYKDYDYLGENKYLQEPVIDSSINVNSYILDDLLFKGVDYKFLK